MEITGLLIANRGEIAIRIIRAANDLNLRTVAIFSEDDSASLPPPWPMRPFHFLAGGFRLIWISMGLSKQPKPNGCNAIHPGYGFLAEQAGFARRCQEERILFIGPSVENLKLFGDKAQSRQAAVRAEVPIPPGKKSGRLH